MSWQQSGNFNNVSFIDSLSELCVNQYGNVVHHARVWRDLLYNKTFEYTDTCVGNETRAMEYVEEDVSPDLRKPDGIKVYPNPANETLTIESITTLTSVELNIKDITGKLIYGIRTPELNRYSVDLTDFVPGTYILTIGATSTAETRKFIVIR